MADIISSPINVPIEPPMKSKFITETTVWHDPIVPIAEDIASSAPDEVFADFSLSTYFFVSLKFSGSIFTVGGVKR